MPASETHRNTDPLLPLPTDREKLTLLRTYYLVPQAGTPAASVISLITFNFPGDLPASPLAIPKTALGPVQPRQCHPVGPPLALTGQAHSPHTSQRAPGRPPSITGHPRQNQHAAQLPKLWGSAWSAPGPPWPHLAPQTHSEHWPLLAQGAVLMQLPGLCTCSLLYSACPCPSTQWGRLLFLK